MLLLIHAKVIPGLFHEEIEIKKKDSKINWFQSQGQNDDRE